MANLKILSFYDIFSRLCNFWSDFGCILIPSTQTEISSPLLHQNTFFSMIDTDKKFDTMYLQPVIGSKEFKSTKYDIQNFNFLKFQVILKSEIDMPQKLFLESIVSLGFNLKNNDIRFYNKENEDFIFGLNADSYGIYFNNSSIGDIQYIQNIGCSDSNNNIPIAISYDLNKIMMLLQNTDNVWDINWNGKDDKDKISYIDLMMNVEKYNSKFVTEDNVNNAEIFKIFEGYKNTAINFIDQDIIIPAYVTIIKAKYCLDILNFRNYITYNNKVAYNILLRDLVNICCRKYAENKKTGGKNG